jgi:hypothetical protein
MILNIYTIITLFSAALTGALAVPLGLMSFRTSRRWGKSLRAEERTEIENRSYLLLLTAAVILSIKLLSWPFYYLTLQSYVPDIRGAMCIFGATQFNPALSNTLQLFKPAVFFLTGGWLLLNQLDRETEISPLFGNKFMFLSVVSVMVFADSAGDFIYFTGLDTGTSVATYFDMPERVTAILPLSILGREYETYMFPAYYISNIALIVFMGMSYQRFRNILQIKKNTMRITVTGAVLAVLTAVISILAMFEVIAPRLMKLPYHHCIYCMWQYVPDSILMTGLFIMSVFLPCWALLLNIAGRHYETDKALNRYIMNLYFHGTVLSGASLLMVTIHLMFA